jgi:S-formylglutathione hydrolase
MATKISDNKIFGGHQQVFSHNSEVLKCEMKFSVYLPPQSTEKSLPVLVSQNITIT